MSAQNKTGGRICIIAAALLWGLAGVCVKSIEWNTMQLVCARSLLSFLVLLAYKRSLRVSLSRENLFGALMMSATGLLYVQAIKLTTAGTAIVLQYIAPILVFLYSVLFKGEKARPVEICITAAVFGGIVLSFADSLDVTHVIGNLLALLSGFTFAAQIIAMNSAKANSEDGLLISCVLSFLIAIPFVLSGAAPVFDAKNIFWVLVLGVFQYGLANVMFGIGIKKISAVESSLLLTLEPVFNPIPVALFCGEIMGLKAIIGSVIVIAGLLLYMLVTNQNMNKSAA